MVRYATRRGAAVVTALLALAGCSGGDPDPALSGTPDAPVVGVPAAPGPTAPTTVAPTTSDDGQEPAPPDPSPTPPAPLRGLVAEQVADGLYQPTAIATRDGDGRLFVTERSGAIRIVSPDGTVGTFADLSGRVTWSDGIEKGLLGLAFHPDHADNGRLFVYHVNRSNERQLAEYRVHADDPDAVDLDTERVLFAYPQPPDSVDIRHYGGMLQFGPDGMLHVASGDGADARGQGQDPGTPFGTILRLDVDGTSSGGSPAYGIPADNPFATGGGAPEVWAYGLRNPWRFHIDEVERLLYVADVGQERWEEINVVSLDEPGANFGWPDTEGARCFLRSSCVLDDYTMPVVEYGHDEGCSVTGGIVYRGTDIPELWGHYVYGDWCRGWLRSFRHVDGEATEPADWSDDLPGLGQINAFGAGPDGELYLVTYGGALIRVAASR